MNSKTIFKQNNSNLKLKSKPSPQQSSALEIRIQKIRNQIKSLNVEIKFLMQEKDFKDKMHNVLSKQRKILQGSYLYKNVQRQRNYSREKQRTNDENMNQDNDVNKKILQFIQLLNKDQSQQITQSAPQNFSLSEQKVIPCQSSHLLTIFDYEYSSVHNQRLSQLKIKLSLLYQKLKFQLEQKQPELWQKFYDRISNQAKKQSRTKILIQIQKMIKQNSKWIQNETLKVQKAMEQKEIQQFCCQNIALMKKIMNKKVSNNDFIYQNYSRCSSTSKNPSSSMMKTFPTKNIQRQYAQVLKSLHQKRISNQLNIVKNISTQKQSSDSDLSLIDILSSSDMKKVLQINKCGIQDFQQTQKDLIKKAQILQTHIQKLIKN